MQGNKQKNVDWSCVEQFPFEYKWKTMQLFALINQG